MITLFPVTTKNEAASLASRWPKNAAGKTRSSARLLVEFHADLELPNGFIRRSESFFAMAAEIVPRFLQMRTRVLE